MAYFQNNYGAAQTDAYGNVPSTDEYGNVIDADEYGKVVRTDEYGIAIPTDDYGNPIRHSGTTLQGVQQQQQRHHFSTEYDGQGRGRKNKAREAAHSTDAYGNVIRQDEYGNVIPTDEYGNPIRHSGTSLQGVQQQQQRHDLSTEYDGLGRRRRNKAGEAAYSTDEYGNVIRTDEYGNVIRTDEYGNPIRHSGTTLQGARQQQRHDLSTEYDGLGGSNVATTYTTTAGYGTGEQAQHYHYGEKKGVMEKIKEKLHQHYHF